MTEVSWSQLPEGEFRSRPAAMTVGVFDGLHMGHQALVSTIAADPALNPVVVTFARHPTEVLAVGKFPGFILSRAQKREAFRLAGVGVIVWIDFSYEFSRIPGAVFLQTLVDTFDLHYAGIGHDFRCGHRMSMDAAAVRLFLQERGVDVCVAEPIRDGAEIVSSTRIRALIRSGQLAVARRLLGRPYALDTSDETICHDASARWIPLDGNRLLPVSRQIVPRPGEYAATLGTAETSEEVMIQIGENSVCLPLAADPRIRYIGLQENRV